jgi:hypothetical protein
LPQKCQAARIRRNSHLKSKISSCFSPSSRPGTTFGLRQLTTSSLFSHQGHADLGGTMPSGPEPDAVPLPTNFPLLLLFPAKHSPPLPHPTRLGDPARGAPLLQQPTKNGLHDASSTLKTQENRMPPRKRHGDPTPQAPPAHEPRARQEPPITTSPRRWGHAGIELPTGLRVAEVAAYITKGTDASDVLAQPHQRSQGRAEPAADADRTPGLAQGHRRYLLVPATPAEISPFPAFPALSLGSCSHRTQNHRGLLRPSLAPNMAPERKMQRLIRQQLRRRALLIGHFRQPQFTLHPLEMAEWNPERTPVPPQYNPDFLRWDGIFYNTLK